LSLEPFSTNRVILSLSKGGIIAHDTGLSKGGFSGQVFDSFVRLSLSKPHSGACRMTQEILVARIQGIIKLNTPALKRIPFYKKEHPG